jgi:sterol-4alpha-carboxylate 3-dehydrogenase (decarboxylating)
MNKVLITGGCGFVGRHLVDAFADRGDEVTVLDLVAKPWRDDVTFVSVDIRDTNAVVPLAAGADVIVHNASLVHTKQNRVQDVWDVNLGGTRTMLAAADAHAVKRFVYISSASAVYEGRDIENGDETMPYPSISQAPYADSKIAAEKLVLAAASDVLGTVSIRPHVVFGPHDNRFLPAILAKAKTGQMKFSVGLQRKLSDFTYITNLVDATVAAADRAVPGSTVSGQAYFVTNGEPTAFFDFVDDVLEELGLPRTKYRVPYSVAYAAATVAEGIDTLRGGTLNAENGFSRFAIRYMCTHHYFSIDKAKRDLGWAPAVNLSEGIQRTVAHLRETDAWT